MVDRSDRHFRWILRRLTRRTLLFTPMIATGAILHGEREEILGHDPCERPLALQLGGDDPRALAECARVGTDLGYDEIDLNAGCPSESVGRGGFGASLMARPERVAEAVAAMRAAVPVAVTVKHRIGIVGADRYEDLARFVEIVAEAGCDGFIVHARAAWLDGRSPKQNRTVPPLRRADVHRLKREHPSLRIELNGGIRSLEGVRRELRLVDGVMIGRAAFEDPYLLATADLEIFGEAPLVPPTRREVIEATVPYAEAWTARGLPLFRITRHLAGLLRGMPGARAWRRLLDERTSPHGARAGVLLEILREIPAPALDARPVPAPRPSAGPGAAAPRHDDEEMKGEGEQEPPPHA